MQWSSKGQFLVAFVFRQKIIWTQRWTSTYITFFSLVERRYFDPKYIQLCFQRIWHKNGVNFGKRKNSFDVKMFHPRQWEKSVFHCFLKEFINHPFVLLDEDILLYFLLVHFFSHYFIIINGENGEKMYVRLFEKILTFFTFNFVAVIIHITFHFIIRAIKSSYLSIFELWFKK